MRIRLFSILDNAVEAFNIPFSSRTVAEAQRNFALTVTRDENIRANGRDYVLFEVGSFDDSSGVLESIEPRRIMSAADAIVASEEGRLKDLTPNAQR